MCKGRAVQRENRTAGFFSKTVAFHSAVLTLPFMIVLNYVRLALLEAVKAWARRIRRDVLTVYYAARDPRTPLFVRELALIVAAYARSPIDLIPDFIPVIDISMTCCSCRSVASRLA